MVLVGLTGKKCWHPCWFWVSVQGKISTFLFYFSLNYFRRKQRLHRVPHCYGEKAELLLCPSAHCQFLWSLVQKGFFCIKDHQYAAETKDCALYFMLYSATLQVNQPWQLPQWY